VRRFDPLDRVDTIDGTVERSDLAHAGALGAGNEIRRREVDPFGLVHLESSQEQTRVNAHDRVERDKRAERFGDLISASLLLARAKDCPESRYSNRVQTERSTRCQVVITACARSLIVCAMYSALVTTSASSISYTAR
jgi:hypothetical protein